MAMMALALGGAAPARAADDLLPDLYMARPSSPYVEMKSGDRRLLRFGTLVWNVGDGPLEVRARNRSGSQMTRVVQWVRTSDGLGHAYLPSGARAFYSGDGHDHWHIERFVTVTLIPAPGAQATAPERHLRKIGFCLIDQVRAPAELRPVGTTLTRNYRAAGCGTSRSTKVVMGLSVGFGDDYMAFFAHQSINVTDLPVGRYRLCATVNASSVWREKADNATNNSYWLDLDLDAAANAVAVVDGALGECDPPPPPS